MSKIEAELKVKAKEEGEVARRIRELEEELKITKEKLAAETAANVRLNSRVSSDADLIDELKAELNAQKTAVDTLMKTQAYFFEQLSERNSGLARGSRETEAGQSSGYTKIPQPTVFNPRPNPVQFTGGKRDEEDDPESDGEEDEVYDAYNNSTVPTPRYQEETQAIFKQRPDMESNFNMSNLTRALNLGPQPVQCSTPEHRRGEEEEEGEFYSAAPIPYPMNDVPMSCPRRTNFNQTLHE